MPDACPQAVPLTCTSAMSFPAVSINVFTSTRYHWPVVTATPVAPFVAPTEAKSLDAVESKKTPGPLLAVVTA